MDKSTVFVKKNKSITDEIDINKALLSIGKSSKNKDTKNFISNFTEKSDKKSDKSTLNNDITDNKKYDRPTQTYTDKLSKDDVEKKLEDYKKVDDIYKIPLNTHLRYFIKKDDQLVFRMGGILKNNNNLPDYVILKSATGPEWSVQVKDTIFFKKMTVSEIKEEYEKIITDLNIKIKKLKNRIKELE